ncbi:MAG: zinc ribbon domain-containing protein [Armatimonas sp.]
MPTYGYRCTVCGHEFERVQKMSDAPLTECEACGEPVKKILYPVGIAFKGTGFYVNDYKPSGGKTKTPAAETSTETKSDTPATTTTETSSTSSTTTTESKPAAAPKTETKTPAS